MENDDGEYYDEEIDEYCGPWSDLHVGGMTASVLIIIAAVMLFAAFFMQGRPDTIETTITLQWVQVA